MTTITTTQLELFPSPPRWLPTGYVYYGTDGVNIKIGYSTSLRRRGGELKLAMLHVIEGDLATEREHHQMWYRHRIGGSEWFRPDFRLLEWLDRQVPVGSPGRAALRLLIFRPWIPAEMV